MRDNGVVHVLPEERGCAKNIKRDAVGDFDKIELFLLRHHLINVGFQVRVGLDDFCANGTLRRRLDLGLGARRDAARGLGKKDNLGCG